MIESLFYLWRITKDTSYREWGWQIFQHIHMNTLLPSTRKDKTLLQGCGYSGVLNTSEPVNTIEAFNDQQPSYLLGETFKYLYLLFSEDDVLPLSHYVFNTEGHPLRILPLESIANSTDPRWQKWWKKIQRGMH